VQISVSTATPHVGEDVTVKVHAVRGPAPGTARWSFGDGQVATGPLATHRWAAPRTYQLSVRATFPGGQSAAASTPIVVTAPPPGPALRAPGLSPARSIPSVHIMAHPRFTQTFTVTNPNDQPMAIAAMSTTGDPDFSIASDRCSPLPAAGTCDVLVSFNPRRIGAHTGRFTVTDAGGRSASAELSGSAFAVLSISVESHTVPQGFGTVVDNAGLVSCSTGTCTVRIAGPAQQHLTLTAKPASCGVDPCFFVRRTGSRCAGTNPGCTLDLTDMTLDEQITAEFGRVIG